MMHVSCLAQWGGLWGWGNLSKLLFPIHKMELILLAAPSCVNSLNMNIKVLYPCKNWDLLRMNAMPATFQVLPLIFPWPHQDHMIAVLQGGLPLCSQHSAINKSAVPAFPRVLASLCQWRSVQSWDARDLKHLSLCRPKCKQCHCRHMPGSMVMSGGHHPQLRRGRLWNP